MKQETKKLLKRALAISLSLCLGTAILSSCKKKPEQTTEVDGYYNPMQGIDTNKPLSKIVENGQTDYKIVIPTEASECEIYAAEELQKYLQKSTGAKLAIVTDSSGVQLGDKLLSVGATRFVNEAELETKNLNVDGFKLKTEEDTLLIKGERDRGTLYGVYDFCEKFIGARFLTPEFEYVPALETLTLYEADVTEIPDVEMRTRFEEAVSTNMAGAARMRLTGPENPKGAAAAKFGGGYKDDFMGDMHAYNGLVSYTVYGEATSGHVFCENPDECEKHTDWFATPTDNSGEGDPYPQWCLSNGLTDDGEVANEKGTLMQAAISAVKARILEYPIGRYVAFGQNDNRNVCNCEDCERQRALFGGYSGHTVAFTNAVAKAVDASLQADGINRELYYVTYAYMYTVDAPDATAPRADLAIPAENVYVQLCPYYDYFNSPLNDVENNYDFATSTTNWAKITNRFFIFDYAMNYTHYCLWYPNLGILKPNIEWYKQLGVKGIVTSGSRETYEHRLETYLFSKLEWNVNRDVNELISEFNALYFGAEAGAVMDEFVDFNNAWYERAATKGNARQKAGLYNRSWQTSTDTLSVDYVRQCQRYIDDAKACIQNDKTTTTAQKNEYLKNLMRAEVIVDFSKYYNYTTLHYTTQERKDEFMRSFYKKLTTVGLTSFGMGWDKSISQIFAEMGIY